MTEEKREAIELVLSNRLFLYSLMHKLFGREPDAEMLNILTDEHTGEAFALLSEEEGDIMDRTASFLDEIREEKENPAFLEEAKDEYTRLFIGPVTLWRRPGSRCTARRMPCSFRRAPWRCATRTGASD